MALDEGSILPVSLAAPASWNKGTSGVPIKQTDREERREGASK